MTRTLCIFGFLFVSLSLVSEGAIGEETLIAPGSVWKYDDTGADLGTAWRESAYVDSGWASGPAQLGYGDADEATILSYGPDPNNKYRCYYFRHTFGVPDPNAYDTLTLGVVRDDGCIVYLNGIEVVRSNMPQDPITYLTFASAVVGVPDESTFFEFSLDPALLVAGDNVIAVEVHQVNATSSDISFDLELEGVPPLPEVTLESPADQSIVNTTDVTFTVSATDASGLQDATLYIGGDMTTVAFSGPDETDDAQLTEPDGGTGTGSAINVDGGNPHAHGLIKFLNVFGEGIGQVPLGSIIVSATLQVNCTNPGNMMNLYRLNLDWVENGVSWIYRDYSNSLTWPPGEPGADGPYSHGSTLINGDCTASGLRTIDITQLVQEWSNGSPNYGIVMTDTGTDGVDFDSSESANPPVLTVTYQPVWEAIETKPLSGTSDTVTFNKILDDQKDYLWNCLVTNTSGEESFAPADFWLTVDISTPDEPVLVAPADGAAGEPTSPLLEVTVTDPNGDALDVTFYGRKASGTQDFTIVALPDTQNYSMSYPDIFAAQTQWIVDNAVSENIVFVTHEGDIVETASVDIEWQRADASMSLLDGVVPYGMGPGNHDIPTTLFNTYFPYTRYQGVYAWYGGHYGSTNDNNYQLFSSGGNDYVIIHLQYNPDSNVIAWADGVLATHADRKAIITTHAYLNSNGSILAEGAGIWNDLVPVHDNVYFVLCGHVSSEYNRTDVVNGRQVHQLLADYQGRTNGGDGWLRIMRFASSENKVYVQTYSPWLDQFEVDGDSQFTLDFDMDSFEVIATNTGIPSGSNTSTVWANLEENTEYEWYVAVTDPTAKTQVSPIWRFTTGGGDVTPPIISDVSAINVTDNSVTITWATDEPADSLVEYSIDTSYSFQVSDSNLVTFHSIILTNLSPETTYNYRVTSQDSSGNSSTDTGYSFNTEAGNHPPIAADDGYSVYEDNMLIVTVPGVLTNDTDADNDALTAILVADPANASSFTLNSDGSFDYTPVTNFFGSDTFTYMANDGVANSNVARITIAVNPMNDLPVAEDDSYSVDEDTALVVNAPGVLGNDSDVDGDSQIAILLTGPLHDPSFILNPDGSFTYTPGTDFHGIDSFTYTANDATGPSNVATVTIVVNSMNDPPVAFNDIYSVDEDITLNVVSPGVLGNDTDVDAGDTLTAVVLAGPTHASSFTLNSNGSFTYTPVANFNGADSFTYKANDNTADSNTATVTITVNPVPDSPVATDDSYSVDEDSTINEVTPGVLGNDTDGDGDPLIAALGLGPVHALMFTFNEDGSFDYTPESNFYGVDTFTYTANDGDGPSNVATVTITVNPVNDPPLAFDDSYSVDEDNTLSVSASGVLVNDTDVDNTTLTAVLVSSPANASSFSLSDDGSFTYTPMDNYSGNDAFTYLVNDTLVDSAPATVSIAVNPVNDPPAQPLNLSATAGSGAVILDWDDNVEPEADLNGYNIYRSLISNSYDFGNPLAFIEESTYTDNDVVNETRYYYVVKAVDTLGLESITSEEAFATPSETTYDAYVSQEPIVTYGAVVGGIEGTTADDDGLVQTITEAPSGGAGMASLEVEYRLSTTSNPADVTTLILYLDSAWTNQDAPADPLRVFIWDGTAWEEITLDIADGSYTPASNPENYVDGNGEIRVQFKDTAAIRKEKKDILTVDLLYAQIAAGPPDTDPPAAPAGLTAAGGDQLVSLDWVDNGEGDLEGYNVYRSLNPGVPLVNPINASLVQTSDYVDTTAQAGTLYYYVATAVDRSQNESGQSNEASATPVDLPPAAPTGLAATPGDSQVGLDWNDNAESDIDGYNVYRSEAQGGPYTQINGSLVPSSDYLDTTVINDTSYYYVVTAVDLASQKSTFSNEASAIPQAGSGQTLHIESITMEVLAAGKNWKAQATVLIHDQSETPQAGALVVGDWYFMGGLIGTGVSATTDGAGNAVLGSPAKKANSGDTFTFVVTDVVLAGYNYEPNQNVESQDSITVP